MTPQLAAAAVAAFAARLESAWSEDPRTLRRARDLRLSAWAFYLAGRGGVLGDQTRLETVVAAMGVIAPDAVREGWEAAGEVGGPAAIATARLAECARWGDERLARLADEQLVRLLRRVVTEADASGMPLFAATREWVTARDGGPGAQVALHAHLLAEHRAAALLLTTRACGLAPVEAVLAGPEGEQEAITFGWHPPFPSRISLLRRYAFAAALADRLMGSAYSGLTGAERVELAERLGAVAAAVC